jgi:hypothetical protein
VSSVICRRAEALRLSEGIPLDPDTLAQLRGAGSVGLAVAEIERAIISRETRRQS